MGLSDSDNLVGLEFILRYVAIMGFRLISIRRNCFILAQSICHICFFRVYDPGEVIGRKYLKCDLTFWPCDLKTHVHEYLWTSSPSPLNSSSLESKTFPVYFIFRVDFWIEKILDHVRRFSVIPRVLTKPTRISFLVRIGWWPYFLIFVVENSLLVMLA